MIGKIIGFPFWLIKSIIVGILKLIFGIIFGILRFVFNHLFGIIFGAISGLIFGRSRLRITAFDKTVAPSKSE